MKNSAEQGGCYPQKPKAEVDNTLRDLQNSSYPTKAEFNNCFIKIARSNEEYYYTTNRTFGNNCLVYVLI